MRERLRVVPQMVPAAGVQFLGVQMQRACQRQELLAQAARPLLFADQRQGRDQPERADREGPFVSFQAVIGRFDAVPEHQAVTGKLIGDGQDGGAHPLVGGREKPGQRDQQRRRVKPGRSVVLHEHAAAVDPAGADLGVDLVGGLAPAGRIVRVAARRRELRAPVHRHPAHDLGCGEVLRLSPDFPYPAVRLLPVFQRGLDELDHPVPPGRAQLRSLVPGMCVHQVQDHAPHVMLVLVERAVAGPHRPRAAIARQMIKRPFRQIPLPAQPVHDLDAVRQRGFEEEGEVLVRLPFEAEAQQRPQHESGIADPGVTVIPVPGTSGGLRQRRRRGGQDGAGRLIAESLEGQRAAFQERPPPMVGQAGHAQPFTPERGRGAQLGERLFVAGRRLRTPGQRREGMFSLMQDGVPVAARPGQRQPQIGREVQFGPVAWPPRDAVRVILALVAPGSGGRAVVVQRKAVEQQLRPAFDAGHGAHQHALGDPVAGHPPVAVAARAAAPWPDHQRVGDDEPARAGVPRRLQDHGAGDIAPLARVLHVRGAEPEHAGRAVEQRAEDARGVRPRHAQPFDLPARGNQGVGLAVREEGIGVDVGEHAHPGIVSG